MLSLSWEMVQGDGPLPPTPTRLRFPALDEGSNLQLLLPMIPAFGLQLPSHFRPLGPLSKR